MNVKLVDVLKEVYRYEDFNDIVVLSTILLIVKNGIDDEKLRDKVDTFIRERIDELKDVIIEMDLKDCIDEKDG